MPWPPWTPEAGESAGASVEGGGGRSGRGAVLVVPTLGIDAAPGVACPTDAESLPAVLPDMQAKWTGPRTGSSRNRREPPTVTETFVLRLSEK